MWRFVSGWMALVVRAPMARACASTALLMGILAITGCSLAAPSITPTPTLSASCQNAYLAANPIAAENTCPGTAAWRRHEPVGAAGAIDSYLAPASVAAGAPAQLYVSTTAPTFSFSIYRMGYYQGLGARLIYQSPSLPGHQQPSCPVDPTTRMVACQWQRPVTISTQRAWVSGMYLIKALSAAGAARYTFFVLRNPAAHAPILYTLPFTTYQAYNLWGGHSLYYELQADGSLTNGRASVVSFDRPYYLQGGLGLFGLYDLPLLSWMERQGYDMTYAADFDLNAPTMPLKPFKLIISSGHAEYWSTGMRANVTRARDAGVSLAFFGGNQMYWHVRLASSPLGADRVVICYRYANVDPLAASDPKDATVRWRDAPLNQPEDSLLGQEYAGILLKSAPLVLSAGSAPYLTGSALTTSSSLAGLIVDEYDKVVPGETPATLQIIATSPVLQKWPSAPNGLPDTTNATIYTAPSGAKVFDAGTFGWAWGLSDIAVNAQPRVNAGFQKLTANILAALLR